MKKSNNMDINEKQKSYARSMIIETGILCLLAGYLFLMVETCMMLKNLDIIEATKMAIEKLTGGQVFYFLPFAGFPRYTMALLILIVIVQFARYQTLKNKQHHDLNIAKGSSKWGTVKELVKRYAEYEGKDYHEAFGNIILSKNVMISTNTRKHFHALNCLVIGETGGGKSRYILKPNLLQMNCNYVVTDPKGAILQEVGDTLRRFGYEVKVFDLLNMGDCDTYNPLKYCHKESDIKKVVEAFIKNTNLDEKSSGGQDPFWDNSMNALLCACIGFLTQCPKGSNLPYAKTEEVTGGVLYEACFSNLCEMVRMANRKWTEKCGIRKYKDAALGDGKNNTANASELSAIFENLRVWEAERQGTTVDQMEKPYCLNEWDNFKIAPEKTSTTILMTTAVRMDAFNIEEVRNLTSSDSIDLEEFPNKKSAIFVITPTTDQTYNFLVSFLYTQLFDILYTTGTNSAGTKTMKLKSGELVRHFTKEDLAEGKLEMFQERLKTATVRKANGHGIIKGEGKDGKSYSIDDGWWEVALSNGDVVTRRPTKQMAEAYIKELAEAKVRPGNGNAIPFHTRFLLDEFVNTCEIPQFDMKLATMRSYEISATVIIQSITQLKEKREKTYETFDANCPEFVFLGGDEPSNNEYISKKLGKRTIRTQNVSSDGKKTSSNMNIEERDLMKPEELGMMPINQQIVIISHENPLMDEKYDWSSHKYYKYTNEYACDCGCYEAYRFDRSHYASQMAAVKPIYKPVQATASPNVEKLEKTNFLRTMMCTTMKDAAMKAADNLKQYISLEESSTASEVYA